MVKWLIHITKTLRLKLAHFPDLVLFVHPSIEYRSALLADMSLDFRSPYRSIVNRSPQFPSRLLFTPATQAGAFTAVKRDTKF